MPISSVEEVGRPYRFVHPTDPSLNVAQPSNTKPLNRLVLPIN
jgi:hypothetical protein